MHCTDHGPECDTITKYCMHCTDGMDPSVTPLQSNLGFQLEIDRESEKTAIKSKQSLESKVNSP